MKFAIPEISWHNRDPVLSVDFQPKADSTEPLRLATGGTDSHVLIWYISTTDTGSVNLEVAADLTRHQKAVNVVRWSPNGQYLASGDDESIIFIWKKTDKEPAPALEQMEEQYKESWVIHKTLRGHMEDVLDITWSANSLHLASGSVDNKLLIWDLNKGKYSSILTDHKGFVQGVSWDPKGQMIASASTDRVFRTFDVTTKKVTSRSSKAVLPFPAEHPLHDVKVRLYHDDTLQTYYRRLQFSPDGLLLAVPAGRIEPEQGKVDVKPINAVYIYTRYSLKVPACILPCGEAALVTRWSPRLYAARAGGPRAALPAPRRMLLAVATKRSVLLYDTQQKTPIALINNIHYTRLTDLTWSPDGRTLVASSTDGYCSVITFAEGELGEVLPDEVAPEPTAAAAVPEPMEVEEQPVETTKEETTKPKEAKETPKSKEVKEASKPKDAKDSKPKDAKDSKPKDAKDSKPKDAKDSKPKDAKDSKPKDAKDSKPKDAKDSKPKDAKDSKPKDAKDSKPKDAKDSKPKDTKDSKPVGKMDSFITFKAPEKSPKKQKTEPQQKTPIKIDVLEEEAMPSWSDNSNTEIIKPKDTEPTKDSEIMIIDDSEDIKLVYEDTAEAKSTSTSPDSPKAKTVTEKSTEQGSPKTGKTEDTIKPAVGTPKSSNIKVVSQPSTPKSTLNTENNFFKQAKVTDVKEQAVQCAPSPKAPRRVSFVTLSSPKNAKKK